MMELWYNPCEIIERFRQLNPAIRAYATTWYERNKEKQIKRSAEWHRNNPQASKISKAKWDKSPKGKASRQARRIRRNNNIKGYHFSGDEWQEKLQLFQYRCAYCRKKSRKLTVDHIIPLAIGGLNTIDNVVPACKDCNMKKYIKLWASQLPFRLEAVKTISLSHFL